MYFRCFQRAAFTFVLAITAILNPQFLKADHEIVASVNDQPISRADLDSKTRLLLVFSGQENNAENRKLFEREALRMMIREMMQMQFITKLGIKFSDKEYSDALERLEVMNNQKSGFLSELAKHHGINPKILRLSVMANYAWELFISERYKAISQPSKVELERKIELFQKNRNQPHVRLAEIVLPFEAETSEASARETANSILEMLREGASFISLVQQFSKSPTAANGGDLGWIPEGSLSEEVRKAIQGLSENRVTPPVKTGAAYKIFFIIGKRAKSPEPKAITTYSYVEAFMPKRKNANTSELERLKETAVSVQQTARSEVMLRGFLRNVVGHQIKSFEQKEEKEISPAILRQIQKLEPGNAAELVERPEGYYIIVLTKKQTFSGDDLMKQHAENELRYQKLMIYAQKEVRNIRRSAHIDIRSLAYKDLGI